MAESPVAGTGILVVDDEALWRRRLGAYLEKAGAEVTMVGDLAGARNALATLSFDFALVDVNLPDGRGPDLLREGAFSAHTAVVIMTAGGGVTGAVEAMQLGAVDYLTKPFEPEELPLVFARVRRSRQDRRLAEHRREGENPREDEFVFGSALAGLRGQLDRILAADVRMQTGLAPVLVEGETGTGKTSMARWIHARGPRAEQPLVEVNCSALPESLAESELFGHERGAFTDARTGRIGLFEAAHGGTLFLDELASLSPPLQAKVLTAIEDRRVRRVGGNKPIPVDARVIAASNRGLRDLVARGAVPGGLVSSAGSLSAHDSTAARTAGGTSCRWRRRSCGGRAGGTGCNRARSPPKVDTGSSGTPGRGTSASWPTNWSGRWCSRTALWASDICRWWAPGPSKTVRAIRRPPSGWAGIGSIRDTGSRRRVSR
jgi:DNA-binding NtrC family response regulator